MEFDEPKLKVPVTINFNEAQEDGEEAAHSIFCFHQKNIPESSEVKVALPPGFRFVVVLPPGYRFVPKDDELAIHYLTKKIMKEPTSYNHIKRVNVYKHSPQELSEIYPDFGDNEWYFFTPRDRKYLNGSRPNRAAGNGYWKATGADKPIINHDDERVGWKKSLVFYQGRPPRGDKTDWIMHEYMVKQPPRMRTDVNDMKLDDWVLCKIYKKAHSFTKNEKPSVHGSSTSNDQEQTIFPDIWPVTEISEQTYAELIDHNKLMEDNFFHDDTIMNVLITNGPYHDVPQYNSSLNMNAHLLSGDHASSGFENSMKIATKYLDQQGTFQMN